jgi:hypothetical protein
VVAAEERTPTTTTKTMTRVDDGGCDMYDVMVSFLVFVAESEFFGSTATKIE